MATNGTGFITSLRLKGEIKPTGHEIRTLTKVIKTWGGSASRRYAVEEELARLEFELNDSPNAKCQPGSTKRCGFSCRAACAEWIFDK